MTHEQILAKIREITAQGIAYAEAHAEEIAASKAADKAMSEQKLAQILNEAKNAVKHSWAVYESFKNRISAVASSAEQYEASVIKLTKILGV